MSAVLDAIEAQHTTEALRTITQNLANTRRDVRWRYDLTSSRRFPVQYYAAALRGPDADEVLVIGIECFESDDGRLVVSATITGEEGLILAESPSTKIDMPSETTITGSSEEAIRNVTAQVQGAFDSKVVWVNSQRMLIQDALADA